MNDLTEINVKQFRKLQDDPNNSKPQYYCIFFITPFNQSIATFWVKDIVAYLMLKIISTKPTTFDKILDNFKKLIKNHSANEDHIQKTLTDLFIKLLTYPFV